MINICFLSILQQQFPKHCWYKKNISLKGGEKWLQSQHFQRKKVFQHVLFPVEWLDWSPVTTAEQHIQSSLGKRNSTSNYRYPGILLYRGVSVFLLLGIATIIAQMSHIFLHRTFQKSDDAQLGACHDFGVANIAILREHVYIYWFDLFSKSASSTSSTHPAPSIQPFPEPSVPNSTI